MFGLIKTNQNIYNPWREIEAIEKAFFSEPFESLLRTSVISQFPTDVIDEGDHYLLQSDLPGFEKKNITLDIHDDILTLRAERKSKVMNKDEKNKIIRAE